jgi:hypothetical protein
VQAGAFTVVQSLYECGCKNQNATAHKQINAAETEEIIATFFFFGILGFL